MTIYLDLIFFLNLFFDFILLLAVNIILKRNVSLKKLFLGSLFGSLSIFFLFFNINSFELFLLKILVSIIMLLISFDYINIRYFIKNILYLYFVSILLGGFLYFLNITFSYDHTGIIFINNGLSINIVVLILCSPIILFYYINQRKDLKVIENNYYKLKIVLEKENIYTLGFLDTGNNLKDPITNKPIILVEDSLIKEKYNYYYVPYKALNYEGLLKCIKIKELFIDNVLIKKRYLLGISSNKINIDGIKCILNSKVK